MKILALVLMGILVALLVGSIYRPGIPENSVLLEVSTGEISYIDRCGDVPDNWRAAFPEMIAQQKALRPFEHYFSRVEILKRSYALELFEFRAFALDKKFVKLGQRIGMLQHNLKRFKVDPGDQDPMAHLRPSNWLPMRLYACLYTRSE